MKSLKSALLMAIIMASTTANAEARSYTGNEALALATTMSKFAPNTMGPFINSNGLQLNNPQYSVTVKCGWESVSPFSADVVRKCTVVDRITH